MSGEFWITDQDPNYKAVQHFSFKGYERLVTRTWKIALAVSMLVNAVLLYALLSK